MLEKSYLSDEYLIQIVTDFLDDNDFSPYQEDTIVFAQTILFWFYEKCSELGELICKDGDT